MTNTSKTIIFFGSGPVAAASLESLAKHCEIEAVITKAVPPHHKVPAPVETLSTSLGIPTFFANKKNELDELILQGHFTSTLGVVVDYGVIMSQETIDSFPLGILNSHFSVLPEWRGADPITFSILSGQPKTGVSLMLIDPTLDTGKILTQKSLFIDKDETAPSLTDKLVALSNELLEEYIPLYFNGDVTARNQPHPDRAIYSRKLTKADSILDANKPAATLECEVRAFIEWPRSRMTFKDYTLIVTKTHVSNESSSALDILCADKNYLIIDEVIAPSGRKMSAASFLNGYN